MSAEARRNQLMRDMAQLRLQAEVSQLEGSLKTSDTQPKLPPYLVPDAPSLCDHWSQLRQLALSSKFIIIIPLTGETNWNLFFSVNAKHIFRLQEARGCSNMLVDVLTCSYNVHNMLVDVLTCSYNVHNMLVDVLTCSYNVHNMLVDVLLHACIMFTTCSWMF